MIKDSVLQKRNDVDSVVTKATLAWLIPLFGLLIRRAPCVRRSRE